MDFDQLLHKAKQNTANNNASEVMEIYWNNH